MNKVYALIGPPASGKTCILRALAQYNVPEIISHTTRKPRAGEENGIHYYFVNKEEFLKQDLIERVEYSGNFYGLSKNEVLTKVNQHPVSVVAIEMHGLSQLKKLLADRLESIFLLADQDILITRMLERGDDTALINQRLEYAKNAGEFNQWQTADYVVKNTVSFEAAVRQVLAIIGKVILPEKTE